MSEAAFILLGLARLAAASVQVVGPGSCPSPEAVQRHLAGLQMAGVARVATLRETPAGLELSLADADGTVVSQRLLAKGGSCERLAEVAALLLASWQSELASQADAAKALPAGEAPRAPGRPRVVWEVGAGATGSLTTGGPAAGGLLQLAAGPARARWALRLVASYDGTRQIEDGPGQVLWQTVQGGLGASFALFRPPFVLELGADALLADILLQGKAYAVSASSSSLCPGVDLTAKVLFLRGHWHPWLGVWGTADLRAEVPSVQGLDLTTALPPLSIFAGLGIAWQSVERY